jgi:hypothetical protein
MPCALVFCLASRPNVHNAGLSAPTGFLAAGFFEILKGNRSDYLVPKLGRFILVIRFHKTVKQRPEFVVSHRLP